MAEHLTFDIEARVLYDGSIAGCWFWSIRSSGGGLLHYGSRDLLLEAHQAVFINWAIIRHNFPGATLTRHG